MSSEYEYSMNNLPRQYSMNLPPEKQLSSPSYDGSNPESYNNGNGFTPMPGSNRGSAFFQNSNNSNNANSNSNSRGRSGSRNNRPDYANGGAAAGRSCLVVPSFSSGKKKKKKEKMEKNRSPNRTPKKRGGGFFGGSPSSTASVSTSGESSMADPYQTHTNHSDKQSLLKSFSKKKNVSNKGSPAWYLETMVEEDEDLGQDISLSNSNSNSNHRPAQFDTQERQQQIYSQFTPPQRENTGGHVENFNATNSASSTDAMPNLLQLPQTEDRSHHARSRQKKMHAYQGELEPEGMRGQEATIATVGTGSMGNSSRGSHSPSMYEVQQASSHLSNSKQVPVMRDFTNSKNSESSSQLLPIHEGVSNHQRHLQNPLLLSPGGQGNHFEYDKNPNYVKRKSPTTQSRYSPGYQQRMKTASSVIGRGHLSQQQNDYEGYDDDVSHEEMISHNRAEFEREYKQQHDSRQISQQQQEQQNGKSSFADANKERLLGTSSTNSRNGSIGSEDLRSSGTPTPSKLSRQSAPVNIDDVSFENPLNHIQGIHAMAMEHVANGEFDMALQAFKQVLKVYIEEHGEAHPLTASAYHNLGTVHTKRAGLLPENTLQQRHCREKALRCFQAAARSARDCPTLGPNHPNVAVSLVRIGFLLLQSRQYINAVITFKEALRIRTENYGLYHALVANLFNNLGVCHMHLQQFSEGRNDLQQALTIQKELLVQEEEDSSTALLELADTLCNIGGLNLEWIRRQGPDARHALDAESAFVDALELRSKVLGKDHELTNQIRSLHDMVRSLPMPKNTEKSTEKVENSNRMPTPPRKTTSSEGAFSPPGRSFTPGKLANVGGDFSPAAISDMTTSIGPASTRHDLTKQSNHGRSLLSNDSLNDSADMINTSALTIPALKLPSGESFFPERRSPLLQDSDNPNAPNQHFMDHYDATEESCLLRKPADDEQSASQAGGFVSYARSAVSNESGSNYNESDRMATIRQAKEMLKAHEGFMNSPNRKSKEDSYEMERTIDERDGNTYEDGLVPLAGDWSGPKNTNRLSPDCLRNPSENMHTIHNCAASYIARDRHTEAVALLEMVAECQKVKYGPVHANVGSAVHNVGIAYLRSEVYYKAFQSFEEAVSIRKDALGREHPAVAISLVKFGISLMLLQRHQDSLWIFRDALSIRKQALGDLHPSNARICNNIGCVHVELGNFEEARKSFEEALDIQRTALTQNSENGPMIFGASTTLQNLGYLYGNRELFEKSAMVLRESLSLQERIMPQEHPTVLITLESLAETCLDARRFAHALKYYRQLFDRSQTLEPLDVVKQATTLETIASIYGQLDDPKAQKKKLEMALKFIQSTGGENPSRGSKGNYERRAFEQRLYGELEIVNGDLLRKGEGKNWV